MTIILGGQAFFINIIFESDKTEGVEIHLAFIWSFEWGVSKRNHGISKFEPKNIAFLHEHSSDQIFFLVKYFVYFYFFFLFGDHPFCIHRIFTRSVFCLPFSFWANSHLTYMFYNFNIRNNVSVHATDWISHQLFWSCSCVM